MVMIDPFTTAAPAAMRADTGYSGWKASMTGAVMRFDPESRTAGPIPTFGSMVHETALAAQSSRQAYAPGGAALASGKDGGAKPDIAYAGQNDKEYTFADVLDVINPLQHLPVIGTIYRKFTGDEIKPMSDIIGGAIFGGPIGAVASTVNAIVKNRTGMDVAENALSMMGIDATPNGPKKPDLSYETPVKVGAAALEGTTLAMANLSHGAPRNFAAVKSAGGVWNT